MKKLKQLYSSIIKRIQSMWYGIKIEDGFEYKIIKSSSLDLLEQQHYLITAMGWEKYTDVEAGFLNAWCWYRRKNITPKTK